jgi:hypothetical protein
MRLRRLSGLSIHEKLALPMKASREGQQFDAGGFERTEETTPTFFKARCAEIENRGDAGRETKFLLRSMN